MTEPRTADWHELQELEWLVWFARKVKGRAHEIARQAWDQNPALRFTEHEADARAAALAEVRDLLAEKRTRYVPDEGSGDTRGQLGFDYGYQQALAEIEAGLWRHRRAGEGEAMTPQEALAAALAQSAITEYGQNLNENDAAAILAALPEGWRLTDEPPDARATALAEVRELRALSDAATPGVWSSLTHGTASQRDAAGRAYESVMAAALPDSPGVEFTDLSWVDTGDSSAPHIALVGNGPASPKNAKFIAAAVNYVRDALAKEER